jgi:hypothetical protein
MKDCTEIPEINKIRWIIKKKQFELQSPPPQASLSHPLDPKGGGGGETHACR